MRQKLLSPAQLAGLNDAVRNGSREARYALVVAYKPFIFKQVIRLARRRKIPNTEWDELCAHCVDYILHIVNKYDPDRAGFTTFLPWHIKTAVDNYEGMYQFPYRVNGNVTRILRRVQAALAQLTQEGLVPTAEAISARINLPVGQVAGYINPEDRPVQGTSFSAVLGHDSDRTLADTVASGDTNADSYVQANQTRDLLHTSLAILDDRERRIIEARMGLDGSELTLGVLAQEFGLTKERVRQIQQTALAKLRNHLSKQQLTYEDLAAE